MQMKKMSSIVLINNHIHLQHSAAAKGYDSTMNTILNRTSKPTFRSRRIVRLIFLLTLLAFALAACGSDNEVADDTTREDAAEDKTLSVNQVIENQPTEDMAFSPTRETINFWMETWGQPGKLSYVYLLTETGFATGYYVLEGLPVSYCVSNDPSYEKIKLGTSNGSGRVVNETVVQAPGMDGAYYGGCNTTVYYGKDAATGAYVEFSVGVGQNMRLYDQPVSAPNVPPQGYTIINADGSISEHVPVLEVEPDLEGEPFSPSSADEG